MYICGVRAMHGARRIQDRHGVYLYVWHGRCVLQFLGEVRLGTLGEILNIHSKAMEGGGRASVQAELKSTNFWL